MNGIHKNCCTFIAVNRLIKSIYYSFFKPRQVVLLDYPVQPAPLYSKQNPHPQLLQLVEQNLQQYALLLDEALKLKDFFLKINAVESNTSSLPCWNNGFMPGLDVVLLYTILASFKPKRYIEIGSGTSTKIAAKAKKEQQLDYNITCIDPNPRSEIKSIADEWVHQQLQHASLTIFDELEENDILFFDGSHLLHANSDVQWFFMEVLPRLKKGVLVQVHDIYLPYDYPKNMCKRFYAEQYMLATGILTNPQKFELVAPAFYMSEDAVLHTVLQPLWKQLPGVEQHGGSFWFRIN